MKTSTMHFSWLCVNIMFILSYTMSFYASLQLKTLYWSKYLNSMLLVVSYTITILTTKFSYRNPNIICLLLFLTAPSNVLLVPFFILSIFHVSAFLSVKLGAFSKYIAKIIENELEEKKKNAQELPKKSDEESKISNDENEDYVKCINRVERKQETQEDIPLVSSMDTRTGIKLYGLAVVKEVVEFLGRGAEMVKGHEKLVDKITNCVELVCCVLSVVMRMFRYGNVLTVICYCGIVRYQYLNNVYMKRNIEFIFLELSVRIRMLKKQIYGEK